ncbi:MAG: FAD-binding protein [Rickettsiales bacterium]|nr:FAD-binding protein [Rickettsiales bacterium]
MMILVIAEHDQSSLNPATRAAVGAAKLIGGEIHVLVAGAACDAVCEQAKQLDGVAKVLHAHDDAYAHPLAENMAKLIHSLAVDYGHILAAATTTGKDIMPRVAAMLDVAQISDIIGVESANTFKRPIYAGNAIETVQSSDSKIVVTVRGTAFEKVGDGGSAELVNVDTQGDAGLSSFISMEGSDSDRPDLASARVVVSGGRGLGDGEKFNSVMEPLAEALGAAIGASRAAVDAGYVPNDYQVGQTGKIVAPELYIAVGISGAIQHLAGMKESKVIVAINKDENAPIFEIADYGLVADLFDAVPELTQAISS